ncbi:MAG: ATP-binding protein [Clostridia bacterium]|nr:ATP-binding protein [Clostridia bacterium]
MIIYQKTIPSSFKEVDNCVRDVLTLLESHEALSDESMLFKISFVLREVMNNAVEHGNHFDSNKVVHCRIHYDIPVLKIEITDEGNGFIINDTYYEILDDEKRERRRGLKLIEDLNFIIDIENTTIRLILDLS